MLQVLRSHYPLVIALLAAGVLTGILLNSALVLTERHFIYSMDDPYIHMAIAKNLVQHGVWGPTRYEFSFASSSPLWILLLSAVYWVVGVNEIAPFVLCLLSAAALLSVVYAILRKRGVSAPVTAAALMVVVLLVPVTDLVFMGLEHLLHAALSVAFLFTAADIISKPKTSSTQNLTLYVLAPFLSMTRYEGLFLIGAVCVFLLLRRRFLPAAVTALAALLPITVFGIVSITHGNGFLPNSLLTKGAFPNVSTAGGLASALGGKMCLRFSEIPELLRLCMAAITVLVFRLWQDKKLAASSVSLILVTVAYLLEMQFAGTWYFSRYDGYLMAMGITAVTTGVFAAPRLRFTGRTDGLPPICRLLLILVLSVAGYAIGTTVYKMTPWQPEAMKNIYEQQYQMAHFVRRYYHGGKIMANDIGCINYFADIHCVDLWGLGTWEITKLPRRSIEGAWSDGMSKELTEAVFRKLAAEGHIEIAIVYQKFFEHLPPEWTVAGSWTIKNNYACAGETVAFHAVKAGEFPRLIAHLRDYSRYLPLDVRQSGFHLRTEQPSGPAGAKSMAPTK